MTGCKVELFKGWDACEIAAFKAFLVLCGAGAAFVIYLMIAG